MQPATDSKPDVASVPDQMHVLVVDDDPTFRELLTGFLEEKGFLVTALSDGKKALALARTQNPDLVLLDLDLPGISGLDVLRRMSADGIEAPVIAISGHSAADHLGSDGVRLGANRFLTKPVDLEQLEVSIAAVTAEPVGGGRHILVADDDPSIRELLKGFLEGQGFRVDTVADGAAALEAIRSTRPDLVLLDLVMPKVSGVEVLERIQQEGHDVAVITISGTEDVDVARSTFDLGAADFITKPFDLDYLELSLLAKLVTIEG